MATLPRRLLLPRRLRRLRRLPTTLRRLSLRRGPQPALEAVLLRSAPVC